MNVADPKIPRIIHQLWKNDNMPMGYRHRQSSWKQKNPTYSYMLWTYSDIECLISNDYPQWSDIFYGYKENICRIAIAKYLILKKYGGLYVDLDFECLRPIDALLRDRNFVVGGAPHSHEELTRPFITETTAVVCNAWIASSPNHPFWDHFLDHLTRCANELDVLEAAGSVAMTRSLAAYSGKDVTVLGSRLLYPVDRDLCSSGKINELDFFERATRNAYAIHYSEASWFRPEMRHQSMRLPNIDCRMLKASAASDHEPPPPATIKNPLISCLLVTRGNPQMLRQAIRSFQSQIYQPIELVIVTDVEPLSLALLRSEYNDPRIRWVFVPPSDQLTLGALRNVSIDAARGVYLANWDDDDLHDPSRLQLQMEVLSKTGATVCMLERWVVWWPERRRLFLSPRRTWEGSLLCLKSIMPRYPQLSRGEDTPVIKHLTAAHNVVLMDTPRLYVYVVHGDNTWDSGHFESIYQHATLDFSGPEYDRVLHELSRRLDIDLYPTGLAVGPLVGG